MPSNMRLAEISNPIISHTYIYLVCMLTTLPCFMINGLTGIRREVSYGSYNIHNYNTCLLHPQHAIGACLSCLRRSSSLQPPLGLANCLCCFTLTELERTATVEPCSYIGIATPKFSWIIFLDFALAVALDAPEVQVFCCLGVSRRLPRLLW